MFYAFGPQCGVPLISISIYMNQFSLIKYNCNYFVKGSDQSVDN
jgi:hypothetical protein